MNTKEIVTPSTTPNVKGTGKSVPQATADTSIASQDDKNENSRAKFLDQYFIKEGKTHSFWQMWFLNRLRRIPPTRMIRGLDFVVLKNHPRHNNPLGKGTPNGPRGIIGKNNEKSAIWCNFSFIPPYPIT